MPRNGARVSPATPLGSAGKTSHPAHTLPPRVDTSTHTQSSIPASLPGASISATTSTTAPPDIISGLLAGTREDLVDHGLVNRLLALQPNMTLAQMTDVLNILHPDRHRNAAAAALHRASPAPIRPPHPPPVVPTSTADPIDLPFTGTLVNNPQKRVRLADDQPEPMSLLEILNGPSRKKSTQPSTICRLSNFPHHLNNSICFEISLSPPSYFVCVHLSLSPPTNPGLTPKEILHQALAHPIWEPVLLNGMQLPTSYG